MGRAHNANQALNCIKLAQKAGIENISIDLIYGIPCLSDEDWSNNIDFAITSGVPHLSLIPIFLLLLHLLKINLTRQPYLAFAGWVLEFLT